MKHTSSLSIAAVIATASLALGLAFTQYSEIFYAISACTFLLLIAAKEYAPKARIRFYPTALGLDSTNRSAQPLRLAA